EKHGLVTWGETSKESYHKTLKVIQEAEDYIEAKAKGQELFGGTKYNSLAKEERDDVLAQVLPVIRGQVCEDKKMLVANDSSANILSFVNSNNAKELSQVGAACPDHLVHTKRTPLYVEWDPSSKDVDALVTAVKAGINAFREDYIAYF